MKKINYIARILTTVTFLFLFSSTCLISQDKVIAVTGGTIYTVSKGTIGDGTILIREGKIEVVGKNISIPTGADILDVSGQIVMPGLIDCFTNLGTSDIETFGKDDDEAVSPVTPHLRIIDGLNPDNAFIPLERKNGVTAVFCAPGEGNLLSGQGAFISLSGKTVEDMVLSFPAAMCGTVGEAPKARYGSKNRSPMTRMGIAALLRQTFIDVKDHADKIESYKKKLVEYETKESEESGSAGEKPSKPSRDFKLESMIPLINREVPLVIGADRMDDILTILRIASEFNVRIILSHGTEAYRIADKLAERNIPVLLGPVSDSNQRLETSRASSENARILYQAGVKFAFQTGSIRNYAVLLEQARTAVRNGLPHEEALKALTLNAAEIFGVDEIIGSIEQGKRADIVIFSADPITDIAKVTAVLINGNIVEWN